MQRVVVMMQQLRLDCIKWAALGAAAWSRCSRQPAKALPTLSLESKNFNFRVKITKLANGKAERQQQKQQKQQQQQKEN